jgi:hypothetical protein
VTAIRSFRLLASALALAGLSAIVTASAAAEISGPCTASIAGQSVRDRGTSARSDAISVSNDSVVPVTMRAAQSISHLKIEIEFAGFRWTVHDKPSHGNSWASTVPVNDYANYGVGLYKVIGSSSGVASCSGAALVSVNGNPLTTVAGVVGLVAALAGLGGIAAMVAMTMRAGAIGFGKTAFGAVFGIIAGLGLAVLLQEYSVVYPTRNAVIAEVGLAVLFAVGLCVIARFLGRGRVTVPD